MDELIAVAFYCSILFLIGFLSIRRNMSSNEYLIGGRSMNFWVTALAAHASDMSSWLFLAFPAYIYTEGVFRIWAAVGLVVGMFFNWQLVAPRIRKMTEAYNSLTFCSFFESRFSDTSGVLRVVTALMSFWFFTIYITSGLVGLGILVDSLFGIDYHIAITIGVLIVIPYLFFGGYKTLAWIDLFQGLFLMVVIVFVPLYALGVVGGVNAVELAVKAKGVTTTMFPHLTLENLWWVFLTIFGWGLGYFGQPHIVTKFMGISSVEEVRKAKWVGMSWQVVTMSAAVGVGLVGIAYFSTPLANPELVFVKMVRGLFNPMISAFVLCAALAATISTIDSQILVLATNLSEDIYKKMIRKSADSKEMLIISRLAVIFVAAMAYLIAFFKVSSIYSLVFYAWAGLGASFGPILLFSLFSKTVNRFGAWSGILSGGILSAVWPLIGSEIPAVIPSFALSCICIWIVSFATAQKDTAELPEEEI